MTGPAGVPEALLRAERELLAPGGPFEIEVADVLGERMEVFKNRLGSLRDALRASVGFGEREYVVFADGDTEHRLTFAEHERVVASVAAALRDRFGVGPGDRVAILAANCPEWIITFWAAISLGAVAVGLNGWWVGPEIRYGIDDSQPAVLVADRKRLARLEGEDPGVPTVVIEHDFDALWHHDLDASLSDVPIDEDDPALILYTSGTTGRPKGAINTHRNVVAALGISFFHGLRLMMANPPSDDSGANLPTVQLVTSPLFHVSGLHMAAVSFMVSGIKSVWTMGRFDPVTVMRLIEEHRITGWSFTPTMLHRVVTHPDVDEYDLSSLRTGGGGGAPFSLALIREAKAKIPALRTSMGVGYGQTECAALATVNSAEELNRFPESAGRPLPTVQIEIRDPLGVPLPEGHEGEIFVRGPVVMPGYWNKPEATAETIVEGHWLRTGDVGRMDGGRLYLSSRRRDLILRGGENVYPVEIEHCLEEHPSVAEAAVIGVPHDDLGQEVKAIVVPRPGETIDVDELTRWCAHALAAFKVPAHWQVRSEPLPRNATGKVMKHVLEEGVDVPMMED